MPHPIEHGSAPVNVSPRAVFGASSRRGLIALLAALLLLSGTIMLAALDKTAVGEEDPKLHSTAVWMTAHESIGPAKAITQPTSTSTPIERRVFHGLYASGFEVSSFVNGTDRCPGYGEGYWLWLLGNRDFRRLFDQIYPGRGTTSGPLQVVYVRFYGALSPPGRYGHLGSYSHEVHVEQLIEMSASERCNSATPAIHDPGADLVLSRFEWQWPGHNGNCRSPGRYPELQLCVQNQGDTAAGPFSVRVSDGGPSEWLIDGLQAGDERCRAPSASWGTWVEIDPANAVVEVNEYNNSEYVSSPIPALTPMPICTGTPPATPALPDLVIASGQHVMEGFIAYCVPRQGRWELHVCAGNEGGASAGRFAVKSIGNDGPRPEWRIGHLGPGEQNCPAPAFGIAGQLVADVYEEVVEANEQNNERAVPPPAMPPVCTPVPADASPTAVSTMVVSPLPSGSATALPTARFVAYLPLTSAGGS